MHSHRFTSINDTQADLFTSRCNWFNQPSGSSAALATRLLLLVPLKDEKADDLPTNLCTYDDGLIIFLHSYEPKVVSLKLQATIPT
jgi:hypothetical protein